jgi:galactokinase
VTALVTALVDRNALESRPEFAAAIRTPEDLAGYLGAVENGLAFGPLAGDHGVGTAGGSEDHTAILWCRAGRLSRYAFLPVRFEGLVPLPATHVFAVAVSGVVAAKAGGALAHYNELARVARVLAEEWRRATGRADATLGAILDSSPDAGDRLAAIVRQSGEADVLLARLRQFRAECAEIIPGVVAALAAGDLSALGPLVDRSQAGAVEGLRNQVPQTVALQRTARALGAVASSAFGAGFGGSVWALVARADADRFLAEWAARYRAEFPAAGAHAEFFATPAAPGLIRL